MIDERINNTLKALEQSLKDINSAKQQVDDTVSSYKSLGSKTGEFVNATGTLSTNVTKLIKLVESDYNKRAESLEKDRKTIVESANSATQKLSDAAQEYQDTLNQINAKGKYNLILNALILLSCLACLTVCLIK